MKIVWNVFVWISGAMLCGLGFVSAITVSFLDIWGVKQLGETDSLRNSSKQVVTFTGSSFNIIY